MVYIQHYPLIWMWCKLFIVWTFSRQSVDLAVRLYLKQSFVLFHISTLADLRSGYVYVDLTPGFEEPLGLGGSVARCYYKALGSPPDLGFPLGRQAYQGMCRVAIILHMISVL
jgi:hypothetical protein